MKKFFLTSIVVVMMFFLTACGSKPYEGLWKYKIGSTDYTVNLLSNGKWEMTRGEAKRDGTYIIEEKDGYLLITLDYNGSYGYMKWEDNKMCAYENNKCSFYFER